jgi:hypothetical protein
VPLSTAARGSAISNCWPVSTGGPRSSAVVAASGAKLVGDGSGRAAELLLLSALAAAGGTLVGDGSARAAGLLLSAFATGAGLVGDGCGKTADLLLLFSLAAGARVGDGCGMAADLLLLFSLAVGARVGDGSGMAADLLLLFSLAAVVAAARVTFLGLAMWMIADGSGGGTGYDIVTEGRRRKKEEGRRKKEDGRRKKTEEGAAMDCITDVTDRGNQEAGFGYPWEKEQGRGK